MPDVRGMTIGEMIAYSGIPKKTLHRRVDAWCVDGRRDPYAIKGGRSGGRRYIDRVDAQRVRGQELGDILADVTADRYAESQG